MILGFSIFRCFQHITAGMKQYLPVVLTADKQLSVKRLRMFSRRRG